MMVDVRTSKKQINDVVDVLNAAVQKVLKWSCCVGLEVSLSDFLYTLFVPFLFFIIELSLCFLFGT